MKYLSIKYAILLLLITGYSVESFAQKPKDSQNRSIQTAAEQPDTYIPLLQGKKIALVANQTSRVGDKHLVDFLIEKQIKIQKIFALEHGFRGDIDRGKEFNDSIDTKTGIPIVTLYGKKRKPSPKDLKDIDILIFDIQDVGVRFFTYISSMHYCMEACAENNKQFIVFDRPNPLGFYVDGPVLKEKYHSFVGMHPIPVVHGLTVGELALMINGEKWLKNKITCNLKVIPVKGYTHNMRYKLPVKPSPNLPAMRSVYLYPSLCFFEATQVSIGRGTLFPFQMIGYPNKSFGTFWFIPKDVPGMQMNPMHEKKLCYGMDLRKDTCTHFTLKYLIAFAEKFPEGKMITRKKWFNLLAGNNTLQTQIEQGKTEEEIRKTWKEELNKYREIRKKYLLYKDFDRKE